MKKLLMLASILSALALAVGCSPSPDALKKTLEEHPEILYNAIQKHPADFLDTLNKAVSEARKGQSEREEKRQQEEMEAEFKNPKLAEIKDGRPMWGKKEAPITVVEYSDFQCPFCSPGYATVKELKAKYGEKLRFVYKHLPLDMHPLAKPAAQYFEAIALQSGEKALKFHDYVFENQDKLRDGTKFLDQAAKKAGADLGKVKKDLESEVVKKQIEADMAEAAKFGFQGTPGFLVNGVSLRGAYPVSEFDKIIARVLGEKK